MHEPYYYYREVFGETGGSNGIELNELCIQMPEFKYTFIPLEIYNKLLITDKSRASKIYWTELIGRSHLAAVISLVRNNKWLSGVIDAYKNDNYLSFCASLRGLIESASDSFSALRAVLKPINNKFSSIDLCLKGTSNMLYQNKPLEDRLIHFTHARKKENSVPKSHITKPIKEYITELQGSDSGVLHDCYAELCQITHPAAPSVLYCFDETSEAEGNVVWDLKYTNDQKHMIDLCSRYTKNIAHYLIDVPFTISLLIFRTINRYPLEEYHTKILSRINFTDEEWKRMEEEIIWSQNYSA